MPEGHAARPAEQQGGDVALEPGRGRLEAEHHAQTEDGRLEEEEDPCDDVRERALQAVEPVPPADSRGQRSERDHGGEHEQRPDGDGHPRPERETDDQQPEPRGQHELLDGRPPPRLCGG